MADYGTRAHAYICLFICFFLLLLLSQLSKEGNDTSPPKKLLSKIISNYSPVFLGADLSRITNDEALALKKLVQLGKLIDRLYLRQKWKGNLDTLEYLRSESPRTDNELLFFNMMKGPWDRVHGLVLDDPPNLPVHKPLGGNFYPEDMTKEEFEYWCENKLDSEQRELAKGFYHVIKRNESTKELYLKPYSEEYKDILVDASTLLKDSAMLLNDKSLVRFLLTRADAFLSNNYLESEINWLNVSKESKFEITIGPYEVYTDELFSTKSAFEFYIHLRDFHFSKLLEKFSDSLQEIENNLPVPDEYKNKNLTYTPIVVVDQLFASGDVAVPMTAAYNLPNDEVAMKRGGSKLVIIKNVQEGKYEKILDPIARTVLSKDQLQYLSFEAFFTHILLHEVAHSNGPHFIVGSDGKVTVRSKLQEYHSAIEEAKADIAGLFAAAHLIKIGLLSGISREQFYATYLASAFRSIRFGINEAHGLGQCIQLNYLTEQGGFEYDPASKKYNVNFDKIEKSVENLTRDILILQGNGDKNKVKEFVEKYGNINEAQQETLNQLEDKNVPIDVRPIYEIENDHIIFG
nr:1001_t:CDS:2 [Entrophospora candida]